MKSITALALTTLLMASLPLFAQFKPKNTIFIQFSGKTGSNGIGYERTFYANKFISWRGKTSIGTRNYQNVVGTEKLERVPILSFGAGFPTIFGSPQTLPDRFSITTASLGMFGSFGKGVFKIDMGTDIELDRVKQTILGYQIDTESISTNYHFAPNAGLRYRDKYLTIKVSVSRGMRYTRDQTVANAVIVTGLGLNF